MPSEPLALKSGQVRVMLSNFGILISPSFSFEPSIGQKIFKFAARVKLRLNPSLYGCRQRLIQKSIYIIKPNSPDRNFYFMFHIFYSRFKQISDGIIGFTISLLGIGINMIAIRMLSRQRYVFHLHSSEVQCTNIFDVIRG